MSGEHVLGAEIAPFQRAKDYTVFTSDIDLTVVTSRPYARSVLVIAEGSGTLALRFVDGGEETFNILGEHINTRAAEFPAHKITAILSATNVGWVRVSW
jgi:hypothetical protein